MNPILAALLPPSQQVGASATSASIPSAQTQTPSSADAGSAAQFKAQFDQAIAALTNSAGASTNGTTATTTGAQATTAGAPSQAGSAADTLQAALQKKIADLLAQGESVSEIVQQLAASLASSLAQQFGGDPAQIQNQLQTAFASALSPPSTGPPLSNADLASALAQRFRQVADVAAGVLGETGQSNRPFAGSSSDAATTAGVQPAPQPSENDPSTADSTATNAPALLASLTASQGAPALNPIGDPPPGSALAPATQSQLTSTGSQTPPVSLIAQALAASTAALGNDPATAPQGDGQTVASNGAPALGSNGDTLLGRMLARAAQSQLTSTGSQTPALTPPAQTGPGSLTAQALAAAAAALGNGSATAPATALATPNSVASALLAATPSVVADAETSSVANSGSAPADLATATPQLNPAVTAFVKAFSDALATASSAAGAKAPVYGTDPGSLLQTTVSSSQAPTIGAFASVQAVQNDAVSSNGAQNPLTTPLPSQTTVDPNSVVEQLVRGLSLNTVDTTSIVRMRLVPESLGDISVKLTIEGSSVSAQVTAQTPAAQNALVAGQEQLSRTLADAGLKLTSFNVDLAGGFASFQQQQQSSQQGQSSGRTLLLGGVDTTESDDASLVAAPNFGPPVPAGLNVGWGALNYLV